jgi:hypothetical protein
MSLRDCELGAVTNVCWFSSLANCLLETSRGLYPIDSSLLDVVNPIKLKSKSKSKSKQIIGLNEGMKETYSSSFGEAASFFIFYNCFCYLLWVTLVRKVIRAGNTNLSRVEKVWRGAALFVYREVVV